MLGGKMIMGKWRFWRQETKEKTKSPEQSREKSFKEG